MIQVDVRECHLAAEVPEVAGLEQHVFPLVLNCQIEVLAVLRAAIRIEPLDLRHRIPRPASAESWRQLTFWRRYHRSRRQSLLKRERNRIAECSNRVEPKPGDLKHIPIVW